MPGGGPNVVSLIPLSSAERRRKIWALVFAILFACGVLMTFVARESSWMRLAFFCSFVAGFRFLAARNLESWMKDPVVGPRLELYRKLRDTYFDEAFTRLEQDGELVASSRPLMFWWGLGVRRQRYARFRSAPFIVAIYERDGRTGKISVFRPRVF